MNDFLKFRSRFATNLRLLISNLVSTVHLAGPSLVDAEKLPFFCRENYAKFVISDIDVQT